MADVRKFNAVPGGKQEQSEMATAVKQLSNDLAEMLEYQAIRSKIKRQYCDHLVLEGFTEKEALDIVKSDATM